MKVKKNFYEIFSGYQLRQVFVLNRRFDDHLGHHHHHHHQGSVQIPYAADS
jgi:hypothetical protein